MAHFQIYLLILIHLHSEELILEAHQLYGRDVPRAPTVLYKDLVHQVSFAVSCLLEIGVGHWLPVSFELESIMIKVKYLSQPVTDLWADYLKPRHFPHQKEHLQETLVQHVKVPILLCLDHFKLLLVHD